jgi:hypothetical protein
MNKVKIKGITKYAKTRINNYGNNGWFRLKADLRKEQGKIFVESLTTNFRLTKHRLTTWAGWLEIGKEIEIIEENNG